MFNFVLHFQTLHCLLEDPLIYNSMPTLCLEKYPRSCFRPCTALQDQNLLLLLSRRSCNDDDYDDDDEGDDDDDDVKI